MEEGNQCHPINDRPCVWMPLLTMTNGHGSNSHSDSGDGGNNDGGGGGSNRDKVGHTQTTIN